MFIQTKFHRNCHHSKKNLSFSPTSPRNRQASIYLIASMSFQVRFRQSIVIPKRVSYRFLLLSCRQTRPPKKKKKTSAVSQDKTRILKPKRESLNDENSLGYRLSGQRSEGDLRREGLFLAMAETVRDCPWRSCSRRKSRWV